MYPGGANSEVGGTSELTLHPQKSAELANGKESKRSKGRDGGGDGEIGIKGSHAQEPNDLNKCKHYVP